MEILRNFSEFFDKKINGKMWIYYLIGEHQLRILISRSSVMSENLNLINPKIYKSEIWIKRKIVNWSN